MTPANLHPGLNDVADVLEEFPRETARYMTLLHEIDAKCVHLLPQLLADTDSFVCGQDISTRVRVNGSAQSPKGDETLGGNAQGPCEAKDVSVVRGAGAATASVEEPETPSAAADPVSELSKINKSLEAFMPSLEEKMHVSSIMLESLQRLTQRLELAYEIAIKNHEIPPKLRLGQDNHPAMHLHHELMGKVDAKTKSAQASKSESRREAMAANKRDDDEVRRRSQQPSQMQEPKRRKRRTQPTPVAATAHIAGNAPSAGASSNITPEPQPASRTNEFGEPLYCYCNQVAYGEMVGCDGANCNREWFHLACIGFETIPKGKWYCEDCKR